jgi:hypothetical protein
VPDSRNIQGNTQDSELGFPEGDSPQQHFIFRNSFQAAMNDRKWGVFLNLIKILCDNDNEVYMALLTLHRMNRGNFVSHGYTFESQGLYENILDILMRLRTIYHQVMSMEK